MAEHRFPGSSSADSHQLQTTDSLSSCFSSLNPHDLWLMTGLVRRYLPVRTLFQLRHSSKDCPREFCDCNDLVLGKERRKDEARDWYFPLAYEDSGEGSRKWYGLHQWTKEQHTLPDLSFLSERFDYDFEAVSSELLVLSKCTSASGFVLIVCNPLSKKQRVLPRHTDCNDGQIMMSRQYADGHIHTHLVLGDLLNAYKVIRLSTECINVYSSSTNSWACSPYDHPYHRSLDCISWVLSTVCFNGRVYILKEDSIQNLYNFIVKLARMETSCIDPISSTCEAVRNKTYSLRIYDMESGEHVIKRDITFSNYHTILDFMEISDWRLVRNPILVQCMRNLYAVVAACEGGRNPVTPHERHETHVANCEFHIFKLTEEGRLLDHDSWGHVVVPVVQYGLEREIKEFWESCRNFNCVARSTVIYLEWSCKVNPNLPANLLEYDVVSGRRRTYTVRAHLGIPLYRGHVMAYTPTLDLEP